MKEVETILGYDFKCKANLVKALTHKTYSLNVEREANYERLSFLGGSVLNCMVAHHFFLETQKVLIQKDDIYRLD